MHTFGMTFISLHLFLLSDSMHSYELLVSQCLSEIKEGKSNAYIYRASKTNKRKGGNCAQTQKPGPNRLQQQYELQKSIQGPGGSVELGNGLKQPFKKSKHK